MPRFTRDQRFRKAFDVYMYDFVSSTDLVDLRQWKLNRISENQTSCEHIYGLSISSDYIMYTVDAHTPIGSDAIMYTVDAHTPIGSDAMQVSEDVYGTQQLPSLRELKAHFTAYFKPYDLVIGDTIMSYIELLDMDDQGDEINAIVRVIYHKKHMPYPVPPCTEIEELRQKNQISEERIDHLKNSIERMTALYQTKRHLSDKLSRRLSRAVGEKDAMQIQIEKKDSALERMRKIIRESYSGAEECPVCYESICSEKLIIPDCCHYICADCNDRCTNGCPICREK